LRPGVLHGGRGPTCAARHELQADGRRQHEHRRRGQPGESARLRPGGRSARGGRPLFELDGALEPRPRPHRRLAKLETRSHALDLAEILDQAPAGGARFEMPVDLARSRTSSAPSM
jgi:hypothetical protein